MINNGNKKCPYCKEEIKADAIKCMYCETMLNGESESERLKYSANNKNEGRAKQSITLGIIGVVLFFLPIVSLILSGIGLASGIKGLKTVKRKLSVIGIIICAFGLLINIGFYVILFVAAASTVNEMEAPQIAEEIEEAEEVIADSPESLVTSVVGTSAKWGDPIIDIIMEGETLNLILIGRSYFITVDAVESGAFDNMHNTILRDIWLEDSCEIFKQVFDLFPEVNRTYIEWQCPVVDSYGNEELVALIKVELDRESEATINWEDFPAENLPEVASFYWQDSVWN